MNDQQQTDHSTAGKGLTSERCLCHEVLDLVRTRLTLSPAVRKHLENSRVEFLKAIREVIDERIEHVSKAGQQGTRISVE